MTPTKFDTILLPLYRSTSRQGSARKGELLLSTDELIKAFETVCSDERKYGINIEEETPRDCKIGDRIHVELNDPSVRLGLVAESFQSILDYPRGRSVCPRFFWLGKSLAYNDEALSREPVFSRYQLLLQWVELLAQAAAFFEKDKEELVFLKDGKVSLPVLYSADDLMTFDAKSLQDLLGRFSGLDKMRDQMLSILSEAVLKQISGVEPKRRFVALLQHLPETLKSFDDGHRLYAANFSYEKVRDELQAAMLEELSKINKTFADVQGQILGIPVATVLVATQFKMAREWGQDAWVNTAVFCGVLFFVILANFVMRNQLHSLDAIAAEIERKEEKIKKEYAKVQDVVAGTFPKLRSRLRWQRAAFWTVQMILLGGAIATSVFYLVMTKPAMDFVRSIFGAS